MFETVRYESGRRIRGSVVIAAALALVSAVFVGLFPSFRDAGAEELADGFPPVFEELFGVEAMGTVEGFLAVEVYNFVWVLLLGLYFAYAGAGLVARDVQRGRMDLLLSYPISRRGVVAEKVGALAIPLIALNVVVPVAVYGAIVLVGESIDPAALAAVHVLSIPYLLACAGLGVVLSVTVRRAETAQRFALGLVFLLWLTESIVGTVDDLSWIGAISPARYYDPTAILVHETYELVDATILLVAFAVLVVVAAIAFQRRDL